MLLIKCTNKSATIIFMLGCSPWKCVLQEKRVYVLVVLAIKIYCLKLIKLKFIHFSVDATVDGGSLGRLVNDSRYFPNAVMENIHNHFCLFALKNIKADEDFLC